MIKLTSRRAALVLAGSAVALVAGMLPAQAATTGWRSFARVSVKGDVALLTGVDAVAKGDAWAVGGAATTTRLTKPVGIIEHWTGKSWRRVSLPATVAKTWNRYTGLSFPVVGASSATNVWAFSQNFGQSNGANGYLRLNGRKWTAGTLPGTRPTSGHIVFITGTRVISTKDVWVFGGKLIPSSTLTSFTPYAAQYNGHKWTTKSIPGAGAVVDVSEISAGNMWAAIGTPLLFVGAGAGGSTPSVDHWNGKTWAAAPVQPTSTELPAGANLDSILAAKGGKVWIGGGASNAKGGTTEFAAELSSSAWTATTLPATASANDYALTSMAPDGHGGIWAAAGGVAVTKVRIWHLTGGTWTGPSTPAFGSSQRTLFQLAAVPGTSSVWGVGAVARGTATQGLIALEGPTPR
jgi:hypothetical protein